MKSEKEKALNFAIKEGINVIPVQAGQKRAKKKWKKYQYQKLPDKEMEKLQRDENNIAFVTGKISGNLAVVDFDDKGLYRKFFKRKEETTIVETPRGFHVYFRTKNPISTFSIKDEVGKEVITVKGEGSYVVAPGSWRKMNGEKVFYRFVNEDAPAEVGGDFKQDLIEKAEEFGLKSVSEVVDVEALKKGVVEGYRNEAAIRLATWYRRRDFEKKETISELEEWNKLNSPPLEIEELKTCIESAYMRDEPYKYRFTEKPEKGRERKKKEEVNWHEIAEGILKENAFICFRDTEELYIYKDGVYVPGETYIKEKAGEVLGEATTTHYVNEILNYIKIRSYVERSKINDDSNIINVKNGLLDIRTGELKKHSSNFISFSRINAKYKLGAECKKIERFLREIVGKENVDLVYEIIGYCLYREYPIQKAFMFVGDGANGKSTLLELIKVFLGEENVSHIPFHELDAHRFSLASLFGKLANIYADIPTREVKYTGRFKMLTGGDTVYGEKKFKDYFPFKNYAKLLFSANTFPEVNDSTYAFWRRWILLNFPNKFEGEKQNKDIILKLTEEEELSGLLNKAIKGLQRLLERGRFEETISVKEVKEEWKKKSDSIYSFVMERIVKEKGASVEKDKVYRAYVEYCNEAGFESKKKNQFWMDMPRHIAINIRRERVGGSRRLICYGIRLRSDKEDEEMNVCDRCGKEEFTTRYNDSLLCPTCLEKTKEEEKAREKKEKEKRNVPIYGKQPDGRWKCVCKALFDKYENYLRHQATCDEFQMVQVKEVKRKEERK